MEQQIIYPELHYHVTAPDGNVNHSIEPLAMKYYYEEQIRKLIIKHGFTIKFPWQQMFPPLVKIRVGTFFAEVYFHGNE